MLPRFSIKLHLAKHATVLVTVVWEGSKCSHRGVVLPQRTVGKPLGQLCPGVRPRTYSPGTAESSLKSNTVSKCHLVATGNRIEETQVLLHWLDPGRQVEESPYPVIHSLLPIGKRERIGTTKSEQTCGSK